MKTLQVTRVIVPSLIVLMIAIAIFTSTIFFVKLVDEQRLVGNNTKTVTVTKISFNSDLWKKIDAKTLLTGILSAAAAIAAVAFTITQYIISNVIQKYTPRILDIYFKEANPASSFVLLIIVVGISTTMLLLLDGLIDYVALIITLIIVEAFLFSLILFARNFELMFRVISPLTFMEDLKDMTMENIKGDNNDQN